MDEKNYENNGKNNKNVPFNNSNNQIYNSILNRDQEKF